MVAFVFFEFFLPGVVGKKKFKNRVDLQRVSDIATISDEAFAILLLENSWEKWTDEVLKNTKDPEKLEMPKWTKIPDSGKRYCGWRKEGILHFNELYKTVKQDRLDDEKKQKEDQIEYRYLKMKKEEVSEKEGGWGTGMSEERVGLECEYDDW